MSIIYFVFLAILIGFWGAAMKKLVMANLYITPLMGWMVGLSFFIIFPLSIIVLNGGYKVPDYYGVSGDWGQLDLENQAYLFPLVVVWVSMMLVASICYMLAGKIKKTDYLFVDWRISEKKLKNIVFICSFFSLANFIVTIILAGGIANYLSQDWYFRNEGMVEKYGELFVVYQFLSMAIQVLLTAATALVAAIRINGESKPNGLLLFSFSMLILNMVMTGNRIFIAMFFLYVITALFLYRRSKVILLLLALAPAVVLVFSIWAQVRGSLDDPITAIQNYFESASDSDDNPILTSVIDVTEGANVMLLLNIIKDFGERYDFLLGTSFAKSFTFIIPRSLYPTKPESFAVITAKFFESGSQGSLSSTILGEMYANFGLMTIILMPIMTWVVFLISRQVSSHLNRRMLLSATLFILFAWMARANFSDNFIALIFSVLLIRILRFEKGLLHSAVNC